MYQISILLGTQLGLRNTLHTFCYSLKYWKIGGIKVPEIFQDSIPELQNDTTFAVIKSGFPTFELTLL